MHTSSPSQEFIIITAAGDRLYLKWWAV